MISFDCPNCAKSYTVSDDKAGLRTKCAKCGERIAVPGFSEADWKVQPAPTAEKSSRTGQGRERTVPPRPQREEQWEPSAEAGRAGQLESRRRVRWLYSIAGGLALACVGAVLGITLTNTPAPAPHDDDATRRELAKLRLQTELLAEEQRVAGAKHQANDASHQAALTLLRDEQSRKDAVAVTEEALTKIRAKIAAMNKLDQEQRAALYQYDQDSMLEFARRATDLKEDVGPAMKVFCEQRRLLTEKTVAQLTALLNEARRIGAIRDIPEAATDIKTKFESSVRRELDQGEAILKRPYPDPLAQYKDALVAVQTVNDLIRQQMITKSKKAVESIEKYEKSLPFRSDTKISQLDLLVAVKLMAELNELNADGKLSEDNAKKALNKLNVRRDSARRFVFVFRELVVLAGDCRLEHNPDNPSYAETFDKFRKLVDYDTFEKYLLNLP